MADLVGIPGNSAVTLSGLSAGTLLFRGLGHAAADVDADRTEQQSEEDRHPPAPRQELPISENSGQHDPEDRREQRGQPLARPLPADEKAFTGLGMLDQEGSGAVEFVGGRQRADRREPVPK